MPNKIDEPEDISDFVITTDDGKKFTHRDLMRVVDPIICSCGNEGEEEHSCPWQSDINNDDEYMCNCCDSCSSNCAEDI